METNQLLTYILFTPLIGALLLLVFQREHEQEIRIFGLTISIITFVLSLMVFAKFESLNPGFQFVHKISWITNLNISYHVGVDGLSMLLLLLTTFLTPLTLLSSWKSINKKVKEFTFFMLLLEVGMIGVFVSLDLFLFYVFWEAMLIPMYFIIGIWGGERRIYASVKFFLFTMFGSLLMLVAIIWLAVSAGGVIGHFTTDLVELYSVGPAVAKNFQNWMFLAFTLSFAIKIPLFPLHTWLPDAHVEAPTAGSIILAAVLLKMGTYGLLRFCLPLFPEAAMTFAPYISILAVIGIIYGGFTALAQQDMKKLIAYSSVGHMGFVTLGIFVLNSRGLEGAILQMINHGVTTGALFLCVGMIYERTHSRDLAVASGVGKYMPWFVTFFAVFSLSSFGFPGTNSFIGEFLILAGTFEHNTILALAAIPGAVLAAAYMLRLL